MVSIRLTRTGKVHSPHYRIVVQEKRSKLNGKAIDIIGHYHPATPGKQLVIDAEKAKMWLAKGAQTSDTVTNLFVKQGLFDASRKVSNFYTPKPKAEVAKEEPKAAKAAEPVAEEAAEEVVAEAPEVVTEEAPVAEVPAAETEEAPAKEEPAAKATE